MCQKLCQIYKHVYAVMMTSPSLSSPQILKIMKATPTSGELQDLINNKVVGKVTPVGYIYSEKPQVHVVPIQIPLAAVCEKNDCCARGLV